MGIIPCNKKNPRAWSYRPNPGTPFLILGFIRGIHSSEYNAYKLLSRSSGFRIVLLAAPSHRYRQWRISLDIAAFVPGYGGGFATAFNRLPCTKSVKYRQSVLKLSVCNFDFRFDLMTKLFFSTPLHTKCIIPSTWRHKNVSWFLLQRHGTAS